MFSTYESALKREAAATAAATTTAVPAAGRAASGGVESVNNSIFRPAAESDWSAGPGGRYQNMPAPSNRIKL